MKFELRNVRSDPGLRTVDQSPHRPAKGKLYHLEDYHDLLNKLLPEGEVTADTVSKIHGLMASPHFNVEEHQVDEPEQKIEQQPLIPTVVKMPEPKRAAVFSYFRPGMSKPHIVEFTEDGAALGQAIAAAASLMA